MSPFNKFILLAISAFCFLFYSESICQNNKESFLHEASEHIQTGAEQTSVYFPWIKNKKIAVVANQTSVIGKTHLVDTLLKSGMNIVKVFCPEHGFRGEAEAGKKVNDTIDTKTSLPVVSLYGEKKKPTVKDMEGIEIVIFDIQDVGVRFYTYISTMSLVMEACAEAKIPLVILDRPDPNGHYIDGPVLDTAFASFIGMHKVPIVYGMTMAEYALMVNGEGWLNNNLKCDLKYVKNTNYDHNTLYQLPVNPSPNIKDMGAVYLYPSLCLFEGTVVSVARGTGFPFEAFGHPALSNADFTFTPESIDGASIDPLYKGQLCRGYDLRSFGKNYFFNHKQIYLFWIISAYKELCLDSSFFKPVFDKLAGSKLLREQIMDCKTEDEIRESWKPGLEKFKITRKKYLLYPDFIE